MKKGISLIVLVITIIVMLILAGVGISMVTGEGSVLDQAIKASEKQSYESEKEDISILLLDYNMDLDPNKASISTYLNAEIPTVAVKISIIAKTAIVSANEKL